jgi:hypothetical protein
VLELDPPRPGRQSLRAWPVRDLLRLVEDLEDPLAGGGRALRLADPHAEHAQRHDQHRHVEVEGEELADREAVVEDHPAADEEDRRLREQRHEAEDRHVERPLAVGEDALCEDRVGAPLELLLLLAFLGERLDHVHADDVFLGDRRHVRHLLLDVAQHRMRDLRVAIGERDDERRDRQRDECQSPVRPEHDRRDPDDREDVLEEEDQAVAEKEAHCLEVHGRPRHQLSGLVAIVEAEREAQEVRVERVAHVVLDAQSLPARDEAPAHQEQGLDEADRDDDAQEHPEHLLVARADGQVDHVLRDADERDRSRLRRGGEHDGDDEGPAVGAEEPEQTGERVQVWMPLAVHS